MQGIKLKQFTFLIPKTNGVTENSQATDIRQNGNIPYAPPQHCLSRFIMDSSGFQSWGEDPLGVGGHDFISGGSWKAG